MRGVALSRVGNEVAELRRCGAAFPIGILNYGKWSMTAAATFCGAIVAAQKKSDELPMPPAASAPESPMLIIVDHPLVQHKLSLMRDRDTSTAKFRILMREISLLLAYEATRDLLLAETEIETPLERARLPVLAGRKLCLVSILRAGNGLLDGMLEVVPSARVGHIGLYRDPRTLQAIEYYLKLPDDLPERDVILVDPMLATGNSAVAAISRLKELEARSIKFVCLVAAPEGVAQVHSVFPDVAILAAALDRCLNEHGDILPGLGDAGDRLFGTK